MHSLGSQEGKGVKASGLVLLQEELRQLIQYCTHLQIGDVVWLFDFLAVLKYCAKERCKITMLNWPQ